MTPPVKPITCTICGALPKLGMIWDRVWYCPQCFDKMLDRQDDAIEQEDVTP